MSTLYAINGEIINAQEPLPIPVDFMTKLWENSDPTASFAAQNITLASDDYDFLLIQYGVNNDWVNKTLSSVIYDKAKNSFKIRLGLDTIARNVAYTSATSLSVETGYYTASGASSLSENNKVCVPVAIYGFKKQIPMQSGGGTKYDPETDMIYLWDGTQWVEWKKAGIKDPIPLIPEMTSNTQPSGACTASATYGGGEPYLAFDDDDSTYWRPLAGTGNTSGSAWIDYEFNSVVDINKIKIKTPTLSGDTFVAYSATLSYSEDGSTYQTIDTFNISTEVFDYDLLSTISAKNLRLTMNSRNILASNNYYYIYVNTLQAYE